ncbi:MAG TPA: MMPL family transporter [Candidatus Marinimicrobia bacterium]|nr:MMPL family transporter [Candidatus Neomarinimicrobiota bacterium]
MTKTKFNYSHHPIRRFLIRQSLDHPKRTIILSIIFTILMASGLRFFTIDDDMLKMMPESLESRISWNNIQEEFGSTEVIFIAFGHEGEKIFQPDALATLWDLSEALNVSNWVDEVTSISTSSRMDNVDGFMEIDDLQLYRNLTYNEVNDIQLYLDKNEKIKKQLVSRNGDYLVAIVQPFDSIELVNFVAEIKSIADTILQDYDIHYGGQAYFTGIMPPMIREDVKGLMLAGMTILVIILLLNLRSVSAVGMVITVIMLSLAAMMGFMGWMLRMTGSDKFLFTLANTSMPIILLTIANSDGVHVMTKFFKEFREYKDTKKAVASTMDSLLIPIFLTSITTVAAFSAMTTSPLEPLVGYGFTIGAGILWAWILSSTLLPSLICLKQWNPNSKAVVTKSVFERTIEKLGKVVLTHPKYVFSTGLLIVIIGLLGLLKLSVDVDMMKFFKEGSELRNSMEFLGEKMNGTVDIRVRVEADMKEPETLENIVKLQDKLESFQQVRTSYSIANVVEQMHRTVMDNDPKYETIPDSRDKVNNLFTMYSMSGDPDDFSSMVDYDYSVGLVTAFSTNLSTTETFDIVESSQRYIDEFFDNNLKVDFTGIIVITRDLINLLISSTIVSIIFSLIIIGIIASIFFRKILWGILAVIPLTSAVLINFGFMGHFGIELSHVTAILSSIIIGVGVDFAIHYIAQFRRLSKTIGEDKLSREVVDDVGYPIILDAASNMGFGALLFSAFVPIQYIGGLMVFAMISTSLGTLTVLSALAELLKKKLIGRKT